MHRQIISRTRKASERDTGAETDSERLVRVAHTKTGRIVDSARWGTSGPRHRPVGGQTQMPQDAFHDLRVLDQGEQPQPATAARTVEHVDPNVRRISSAHT